MAIIDQISEYMARYPDACVGELAEALKCSEQSIRRRSAEAGLKPLRTTPARMAEARRRWETERAQTPDQVRDVVRMMIEQEGARIVEQLLARADVKLPSAEQVAQVLDTPDGKRAIAEALRLNGAATLRGVLHHDRCQPIRIALNTPGEAEEYISRDRIQARMTLLFGRGGVDCLDAFMRLIGPTGQDKLFAWVQMRQAEAQKIAKPEAAEG
jgi:hypothetical protein